TISLDGRFIQLLKGVAPLPKVRRDVTVSLWLDGSMHIEYNNQQLNFGVLKGKPNKKKEEKQRNKPAKDHPWRILNNKLSRSSRTSFSREAFG
ncbi:MAG: hypothetical protein K8H86_02905, partial [Ignavibacteriaceae bacterium]|nr:hypothetical protein [Ignavibacteriaceae bacterium]